MYLKKGDTKKGDTKKGMGKDSEKGGQAKKGTGYFFPKKLPVPFPLEGKRKRAPSYESQLFILF